MPWGDVRGLLQYVPLFGGKVFVVIVDAPVAALAEIMLDLLSLQNIGVRLVIGSTLHAKDDLLDRAAEVELKYCNSAITLESSASEILAALNRGQASILDFSGEDAFSDRILSFAHSVSAKKLILLEGNAEHQNIGAISAADIDVSSHPLFQAAAKACKLGVPRVHVLDGTVPGALLSELFSNEGVGTMIYADSYRVIRPIREEDIVELLGMIGRSVRNASLVPRYYVDIEKNIEDYFVMEIDGNVVGSVALYQYEESDMAEIACLYVKQNHEGQGYGLDLVKYAQEKAKELGMKSVFSLTTRIADFFEKKLGYVEISTETIPKKRYEQLLENGRSSRAFLLEL
ncbi:MAG: GNAT family N-acetyltransferase [Akkermansiaceae bacterium]